MTPGVPACFGPWMCAVSHVAAQPTSWKLCSKVFFYFPLTHSILIFLTLEVKSRDMFSRKCMYTKCGFYFPRPLSSVYVCMCVYMCVSIYIYTHVYIYMNIYIYIFLKRRLAKRERERERSSVQGFTPPNSCNNWGWPRPKPGDWHFIQVAHESIRELKHLSCVLMPFHTW